MKPDELKLSTVAEKLNTPEKAREFIEGILWPDGPVCAHCGSRDVYRMQSLPTSKHKVRAGTLKCRACRKKFTVTMGTIFEDTHIPLHKWMLAIAILCAAKKSVSAHQLHRHLGITYKSAWFMAHRLRHAMHDNVFAGKLTGTVEVDECFMGPKSTLRKPRDKSAVVALVQRDTGERRSVVLDTITAKNLHEAVAEHVAKGATVNTDESGLYANLPKDYKHKAILHSYVEGKPRYYDKDKITGEVNTTNYAESSFSLLRRGVIGSFHHISRKHLGLYVGEFDFRWNHRKDTDGERTVAGLKKTKGKRLTYKPLTTKEGPKDRRKKKRRPYKIHRPYIPPLPGEPGYKGPEDFLLP